MLADPCVVYQLCVKTAFYPKRNLFYPYAKSILVVQAKLHCLNIDIINTYPKNQDYVNIALHTFN